jgi:hypothetical protein
MDIVRDPNKKLELRLSFTLIQAVYWKYRGYLSDPRIFISFEDGGVMMSGRLEAGAGPGYLAQLHTDCIVEEQRKPILSFIISSVDWKYGENIHDKRLVFYCENGEVYTSGSFPVGMDVPAIAQWFSREIKKEG